jgi:hypothetical protein
MNKLKLEALIDIIKLGIMFFIIALVFKYFNLLPIYCVWF